MSLFPLRSRNQPEPVISIPVTVTDQFYKEIDHPQLAVISALYKFRKGLSESQLVAYSNQSFTSADKAIEKLRRYRLIETSQFDDGAPRFILNRDVLAAHNENAVR